MRIFRWKDENEINFYEIKSIKSICFMVLLQFN